MLEELLFNFVWKILISQHTKYDANIFFFFFFVEYCREKKLRCEEEYETEEYKIQRKKMRHWEEWGWAARITTVQIAIVTVKFKYKLFPIKMANIY